MATKRMNILNMCHFLKSQYYLMYRSYCRPFIYARMKKWNDLWLNFVVFFDGVLKQMCIKPRTKTFLKQFNNAMNCVRLTNSFQYQSQRKHFWKRIALKGKQNKVQKTSLVWNSGFIYHFRSTMYKSVLIRESNW